MLKYTRHSLKKLEGLFEELEYTVRYEKGNFNSGYCIVENTKVVVINKFYEVEGRMNVLLDILGGLEIEPESLSEGALKTYKLAIKLQDNNSSDEEE